MTVPARAPSIERDAATVTTWNLLSRLTGLARVVVLGGALGATRLGDTYQGSNQVSNVLFELLAAGTLSAILVPGLVRRLASNDVPAARAFAGVVLGRSLAVAVPLVAVGVALREQIASFLFVGNSAASHDAQVSLGGFLLAFVLPQMLLYAWGAVVTAVLHAAGRFAAASIAPVANNVVVTLGLGWLWHRGASGLALGDADRWILGTTALAGVVVMTLVPVVAAWRAGLAVVPRLHSSDHAVGVGRDAAWGSLVLIPAQLVAFGSLVVAGRAPGGVAAYQIAFVFFLLPHALVAHPTSTVLFPRMARAFTHGDRPQLQALGASGLEVIAAALCVAAGVAAGLAPWLVRAVATGALDAERGASLTATALAFLVAGLPAYGATLFLTRVGYAADDVRLPARSAVAGGLAAAVVLIAATQPSADATVVAVVALAHTVMVTTSAALMLAGAQRAGTIAVPWAQLTRFGLAGVAAAVGSRLVASALPDATARLATLGVATVGVGAGLGVYVVVLVLLGQRRLPRLASVA